MKKAIILIAAMVAFAACKKEECPPKRIPAERLNEIRDSLKRM